MSNLKLLFRLVNTVMSFPPLPSANTYDSIQKRIESCMYNIITDMRTYIVLLIVLLFPGICMAANTKYVKPDIPIDKDQLYSSVQGLTA
jgi:hypothetical protein